MYIVSHGNVLVVLRTILCRLKRGHNPSSKQLSNMNLRLRIRCCVLATLFPQHYFSHKLCMFYVTVISIASVCLSVCLSRPICLCSKTKTVRAINTKLGTRIFYSSCSACIDWPRGQKIEGQGHMVTKTVTVTRLLVTRALRLCACCCCRRVQDGRATFCHPFH